MTTARKESGIQWERPKKYCHADTVLMTTLDDENPLLIAAQLAAKRGLPVVAHKLTRKYPDGTVYISLRGATSEGNIPLGSIVYNPDLFVLSGLSRRLYCPLKPDFKDTSWDESTQRRMQALYHQQFAEWCIQAGQRASSSAGWNRAAERERQLAKETLPEGMIIFSPQEFKPLIEQVVDRVLAA